MSVQQLSQLWTPYPETQAVFILLAGVAAFIISAWDVILLGLYSTVFEYVITDAHCVLRLWQTLATIVHRAIVRHSCLSYTLVAYMALLFLSAAGYALFEVSYTHTW